MTPAAGGAVSNDDNAQSTPIQSSMNFAPCKDASPPHPPSLQDRQMSDSSTISSSSMSSSTLSSVRSLDSGSSLGGGQFLLPIPNPGSNKSQASFSLSDDENQSVMLDPLPEEIANADISIARESALSLIFSRRLLLCISNGAGSMWG